MNVESSVLSALKRRVAAMERCAPVGKVVRVATGHGDIDAALDGGVARGRVHEIFALDIGDAGSATGFAGMLAVRLGGGIVWLREAAVVRDGGICTHRDWSRSASIPPACCWGCCLTRCRCCAPRPMSCAAPGWGWR
ncbi:hypothetical protein [Sphingomonas hankookensis]|uniref:hypothetical protein n=1 Tax=Sphingomonas hankookensis TaxID=563996 RepID=UPI003D301F5A